MEHGRALCKQMRIIQNKGADGGTTYHRFFSIYNHSGESAARLPGSDAGDTEEQGACRIAGGVKTLHFDNVRLLGSISENEKSWYYRNCYAFALPSMAEGFGLPVTEAMSVGKPLFLSNRTALPEIGSNVAFYFKDFSASHMQNVFQEGMRDYEEHQMQKAIIERGETFCWDKAADQYLEVYRSLY